jgi:hypothetical protein
MDLPDEMYIWLTSPSRTVDVALHISKPAGHPAEGETATETTARDHRWSLTRTLIRGGDDGAPNAMRFFGPPCGPQKDKRGGDAGRYEGAGRKTEDDG